MNNSQRDRMKDSLRQSGCREKRLTDRQIASVDVCVDNVMIVFKLWLIHLSCRWDDYIPLSQGEPIQVPGYT